MAEIQAQALVMDLNNDGDVEILAGAHIHARMCAHIHTYAPTHACSPARAHAHTHTHWTVLYCLLTCVCSCSLLLQASNLCAGWP